MHRLMLLVLLATLTLASRSNAQLSISNAYIVIAAYDTQTTYPVTYLYYSSGPYGFYAPPFYLAFGPWYGGRSHIDTLCGYDYYLGSSPDSNATVTITITFTLAAACTYSVTNFQQGTGSGFTGAPAPIIGLSGATGYLPAGTYTLSGESVGSGWFGFDVAFQAVVNPKTLTGNVYSACDSSPIAGASVQIGNYSVTTGSGGNYSIVGVPPGTYSVNVTSANSVALNTNLTIPSSTQDIVQDFSLNPLSTVTGHIYCSCDNSPASGVTVTIGSQSGTSDSTGMYTVSGLSPGTYPVTVSGPSYSYVLDPMTVASPCSPTTSDFTLKPNRYDITTLNAIVPQSSIVAEVMKNIGTPDNPKYILASDGTAIFATFTLGSGLTIAQAACKLGFNHFNWFQTASGEAYEGRLYDCSSTTQTDFIDPPEFTCDGMPYCVLTGVTSCENADNLDLYYNEGAAYPGLFNIAKQVSPDGTILRFFDQPFKDKIDPVDPFAKSYFVTCLVGVSDDLSYRFINISPFVWDSNYSWLGGGVDIIGASLLASTNGTGSTVITRTNVPPGSIPSGALAVMVQARAQFAITIQPASQTVVSGANVTMAISPTNSSLPLHFQWRMNGTNITGATNVTLQLSSVTSGDSGNYDALLSDTNGTIGSAVATLTVLNAPLLQSPILTTNGQCVLSWIAPAGNAYQLQYTTNLSSTNWINVGNIVTVSNTVLSVTDTIGSDPQRFYRVQRQ